MIVLVGFMGAGKSTVGSLLSKALGLPFIDTDAEIELRKGMSIAEIFQKEGEPAFRAVERDTVAHALGSGEAVVSLGGGALDDPVARAALEWATVIHLDVAFIEALRRIGDVASRPMLAKSDPKGLYDDRRAVYENLAAHVVDTTSKRPEQIVDEIIRLIPGGVSPTAGLHRIRIEVPSGRYEVIVGRDLLDRVGELSPLPERAERAIVISHAALEHLSQPVVTSLSRAGLQTSAEMVPEGEGAKTLAVAGRLYDSFTMLGVHRNDTVVSVGGGVVCDLAGYVASTYNRGVPVVHVPTTLLAQVDAAIGGKTAVNLSAGKNLVGTFHQPRVVVCSVAALATLPEVELRSGLAEVIKYGLLADLRLMELVIDRADDILRRDLDLLEEIVAQAAAIKARIVATDEREAGHRAVLNYGHTFGHAIEHARGMRHGEAIALGMMAAAYAAAELRLIDEEAVDLHRRALAAAGLPISASFTIDELEPIWMRDKKYSDGVRFVLLEGIGRPRSGVGVPRDVLERVLKRLAS